MAWLMNLGFAAGGAVVVTTVVLPARDMADANRKWRADAPARQWKTDAGPRIWKTDVPN